jgi:hypothetical protein
MEYAVKAETHEGKVLILRRGFASHKDAEDHQIQMSLWWSLGRACIRRAGRALNNAQILALPGRLCLLVSYPALLKRPQGTA